MGAQNQNQSLWRRLRRAVNKVSILLSSTILSRRWRMASVSRSAPMRKRQLSFNGRPGLMACTSESGYLSEDSGSSHGHRQGKQLRRTLSYNSDDDIDRRAEVFIANFRRQLRMERQISLQLCYTKEDSSEFVSPSP